MNIPRRQGRFGAALIASLLVVCGLTVGAAPSSAASAPGAVYTQSNTSPNFVNVFNRAGDGTLTPSASIPTGGNGSPVNPPFGFPILDSQGSVVLHRSGRLLFVVNAGSNTITSFIVRPNFSLQFAQQVPSNGILPISLTSFGQLLYVLNADPAANPPNLPTPNANISGYTVNFATGQMTPIPGSTRQLASPAAPAQVSFDTFGLVLTVTERFSDIIETFRLGPGNVPGPATTHPSTGVAPFGFAYTGQDYLIVSDALSSSVSTYSVVPQTASVTPVDFDPTGQGAPCWLAVHPSNRFAYVGNFGGTVTRLGLNGGSVTVIDHTPTAGAALDLATTLDGSYLYVLVSDLSFAHVDGFQVDFVTGSLTPIGSTAASLPGGSSGIAVL